MSRAGPISLRLVSVLSSAILLCSASAPAAEPNPWLEIHSAHFTVITDAGEKKGREVALRFEQMRAVFANLLSKDRLNQPVPLTILAFRNDESYYQAAPLRRSQTGEGQPIDAPGFFLPGEDQDFIVLNLLADESWRAVAHDFAHMLLNYNYPPAQGWFDEGLAEYLASIHADNQQVEIGGDPEASASATPGLAGTQRDSQQSLTQLLSAQEWIPLPDLFSTKHDPSGYNEGTHHTLYYAESWIVMHYLLHENRLPETGSYFDLVLNQHMPEEYAIQKAYNMTSAQLEQAVKDYFHSQAALIGALSSVQKSSDHPANSASIEPAYRFPAPVGPDDSAIIAKPLPEDDARALYAEVQTRIPERRDLGLKELQALATAPTLADKKAAARAESTQKKSDDENADQLPTTAVGNALAHRILAWDHIQQGEFDEALTELGDTAALNRNDVWVCYYLSVLKYRMAQARHTGMQGLANMMLDLRTVVEWYPEFAAAYDLLALARNEGGGPAAAMQAERAAMSLSPRDERYVYHMAQIYIASKRWESAETLLERLRSSANPEMVSLARERLSEIGNERKYGMAVPGSAGTQTQLTPQKTPFDVLDEDAARRAAQEKAAQSGGAGDRRPTKFLKGRLVAVDCSTAPAAILTVTAEGIALKLRVADYKSLLLIGADQFSCAWQNREVSVNYKPGGLADGDLVSLEVR
ncbi:exported hypothetical protein [Candidatus Sulfotelmatobacter kueseliae]|uniref:DUF1570 domain-containing protein n=1 Tax=Candidatus Sulfotelmatobacter kueseliae TaxID=2042962 RepID=A0A2U3JWF2_9BACT|nr:exported hypothetical protein [Candidatus Sulfotelmatobacter kueseliae]